MREAGRVLGVVGALLAWAGCSFIDSFDYEFADGGPRPDGGVATDGGPRPDAPGVDGGGPSERTCTPPCLADAILDFDPAAQGSGDFDWRYLKDTRAPAGLAYVELIAGEHLGLPAWTDGTPPPAIIACGPHGGAGPCAGAGDFLLVISDERGVASGGDPVLSFTAPTSSTYVVTARLESGGLGALELMVSRNARWDLVAVAAVPAAGAGAVSIPVELLAGDRILVTAAPAPGADGRTPEPGQLEVRLSSYLEGAPLEDCMFAARFASADPFTDECGGHILTNEPATGATLEAPGPSAQYGQARKFPSGSVMKATGARFDYSGDFTVQLWARVDSNFDYGTAIYIDWSAFDAATAGGVSLSIDPHDDAGEGPPIVTAGYLFPDPGGLFDPHLECSDGYCSGKLSVTRPPNGEWHFYRIVRDVAAGIVRFCIDGREVDGGPLPRDIDVSNPHSPWLGSFDVLRDPSFDGAIDDVRVIRRALPCLPPLP